MKIAVTSANGKNITGPAGQCPSFLIYELNSDQTIRQKHIRLATNEVLTNTSGPLSANPNHPLSGIDAFITRSLPENIQTRLDFDGIHVIQTQEVEPLNVINSLTLSLK